MKTGSRDRARRRARAGLALSVGAGLVLAMIAALPAAVGRAGAEAQKPGDVQSVALRLLGSHNLASPGLDGQTKPRGQNGDVATVRNTAFVGGGALFHGAHSSPGRICTDFGGVKVVDLTNPQSPVLRTPITIEDTKGATARGGQKLNNVSVSAGALDALTVRTPTFSGDVLAIATQRCEASLFTGARVEFWDVSNPASPAKLGVFDPESITNPNPPPTTGSWGIFEDIRMFARGERLYALAVTPFSIGNAHDASPFGDFRLLDITDLRNPKQVAVFPEASIGEGSVNGCRTFQAGRAAAPTPDGRSAILSWYDGSTLFDTRRSSAVFKLDLDNLPRLFSNQPITFRPVPAFWGYPTTSEVEGNAADVQPFVGRGGELLVIVSEDDIDPAITRITVEGPTSAAGSFRGCNILAGKHVYELPGQQAAGEIVYVGRACPASSTGTANAVEDELLADPRGKIAIVQGGGNTADGCSALEKARRLQAAGALALLQSGGAEVLNTLIAGPAGGIPPVPFITIPLSAYDKLQLAPAPVLGNTTFPASWERSTTSNVTVVASGLRADRFRFRSVANPADPEGRGSVLATSRFAVEGGQSYQIGAFVQVEALTAGAFRAAVVWYDGSRNVLSESEIVRLEAVAPRTRSEQTVTAPPGAVRAGLKFEWTGANANGTAYVDAFTVVPTGIRGRVRDEKGEWGAQRIIDFSKNPPIEVGTYRSPRSQAWPPPNDGLYAPRLARMFGRDLAFTTWLTDGLRVLDVGNPAAPREVAAYVPPDAPDPAPGAGAGAGLVRGQVWPNRTLVSGVSIIPRGASGGLVVVSDINAGLYVLEFTIARQAAARRATLSLRGHLTAGGRLTAPAGPVACVARIPVEIQRNGRTVRRVTTRTNGTFAAKLRDATGRFRAVTRQVVKGDVACRAATSSTRTHRHRTPARRR